MQALRYGLQKHFLNLRDVNIEKDKEFSKSGKIFKTVINQLKQKGKANVKHHKPVSENDMKLIQNSFDLDDPQGLQRKVFIDIIVYFANRGQENLHDMKPDDFILSEKDGRRCIYFVDKSTKNHQDDDMSSQGGLMFELPVNARCPVASLLKYKSKLNAKCPHFWQRPKSTTSAQPQNDTWYDNIRMGKNTINGMMKTIIKDANCSFEYTNHCLRAMSITVLDHADFPSRGIMTVSGHKSESSIKNYAQTSDQQKVNMSDTLSSALGIDIDMMERAQVKDPEPNLEPKQNEFGPSTSRQQDDTTDPDIDEFLDISDSQVERIFAAIADTSSSVPDSFLPDTDGSRPMPIPSKVTEN